MIRLLVLQLHLMFADSIIGPNSDNGLWGEFAFWVSYQVFQFSIDMSR